MSLLLTQRMMECISVCFILARKLKSTKTSSLVVAFTSTPSYQDVSGFLYINETTIESSISDPLLLSVQYQFAIVSSMVPCDPIHDCLLIFGRFSVWEENTTGNFLMYNISSDSYSTVLPGVGTSSGILCGSTEGDYIALVGVDLYLFDDPTYSLSNVVVCNYITGECVAIPQRLPQLDDMPPDQLMCFVNLFKGKIYVTYNSMVAYWNEDQMEWVSILNGLASVFEAAVNTYEDSLISASTLGNFTSCGSSSGPIIAWNANLSCWDVPSYSSQLQIPNSSQVFIKANSNGLYVAVPNGSSTFVWHWNTTSWVNITTNIAILPRQNIANYYCVPGLNRLICYIPSASTSVPNIYIFDQSTMMWSSLTTCSSCILYFEYNQHIWLVNSGLTYQPVKYSFADSQLDYCKSLHDMYPIVPIIYGMCGQRGQLLVSGFFDLSTKITCQFGTAIWTGTGWNCTEVWWGIDTFDPNQFHFACDSRYFAANNEKGNGFYVQELDPDMFLEYLYPTPLYSSCYPTDMSHNDIYIAITWSCGPSLPWAGVGLCDIANGNCQTILCFGQGASCEDTNAQILTVMFDHVNLYIGGTFTFTRSGTTYRNLAKYDAGSLSWKYIDQIGTPTTQINSLTTYEGTLFVGGNMTANATSLYGATSCSINGNCSSVPVFGNYTGQTSMVVEVITEKLKGILYILRDNGFLETYSLSNKNLSIVPVPNVQALSILNYTVVIPNPSPSPPSSKSGNPTQWWVLALVLIAVLGSLVAIMITIWWYKNKYRKNYIEIPDFRESNGTIKQKIQMIMDDPSIPRIPEESITFKGILGKGGQGEVRKAVYNGTLVAAKSLFFYEDALTTSDFLQEIKLLSSIHYEHIVRFLGIVLSQEDSGPKLWLITELMDENLKDIMHQLTVKHKIRAMIQVAKAMRYLHHKVEPPILHRDLKPSNVLVNKEGQCKLGDFGTSRLLNNDDHMKTKAIGTLAYMAPELFDGVYTSKADVFSYGVMLAEIFDGKHPWEEAMKEGIIFSARLKERSLKITLGKVTGPLADLTLQCLQWDPEKRPSFIEILVILKRIRQETEMSRNTLFFHRSNV